MDAQPKRARKQDNSFDASEIDSFGVLLQILRGGGCRQRSGWSFVTVKVFCLFFVHGVGDESEMATFS